MPSNARIGKIVKFAASGAVLALVFSLSASAATHYVWCGAAGTATGADWTNAYTDLPYSLTRGDTYVVAGSTSCHYAPYKFQDPDSGTTMITVRKAEASLDSHVAGWQATFASAQAEWTEPVNPDPESYTGSVTPWNICTSYYDIDGITGNSDPATGGPSGYGFIVETPNAMAHGIVAISSNGGCFNADTAHNQITLNGIEISGVERFLSATVNSCSSSGSTVSVTFSPVPSWTIVVNDLVDAFTAPSPSRGSTSVTDGYGHAASSMAVASVTGSPNSGMSFTLPPGYVGNPCTQPYPIAMVGAVGPGSTGAGPLYLINGTTDTYSNITVSNSYIHDPGGIDLAGGSNITFTHDFIARNRYTPTEHSNGIVDHAGGGLSSSNVTFSYDWWSQIAGTSVISVFNQSSGSLVTDSNWSIYGNVFWETNPTSNDQMVSGIWRCFGTTVQPVACSHFKFYNNTIYNFSNNSNGSHSNFDVSEADPSSRDIEIFDNLFLDDIDVQANLYPGNKPCYDATAACASTAQIIQDYNFYDGITGTMASDAHGQNSSVSAGTLFVNAVLGNFDLLLDTNSFLSTAASLPGNLYDAEGSERGGDGKWDAGAFQYPSASAAKPSPPSDLVVVSVR